MKFSAQNPDKTSLQGYDFAATQFLVTDPPGSTWPIWWYLLKQEQPTPEGYTSYKWYNAGVKNDKYVINNNTRLPSPFQTAITTWETNNGIISKKSNGKWSEFLKSDSLDPTPTPTRNDKNDESPGGKYKIFSPK